MPSRYKNQTQDEIDETLYFILDIISEGIWDWNVLTGKVYRSSGWFKMLEYDIDIFDETVHTWENIIHKEDHPIVMKHFESYINGEIDTYKIKYRCRKGDGTYLWIEDSGKIVKRDQNGKLTRMIGAHTNIDDIKNAEEKLFLQNELLLADNKSLELLVNKRTQELEEVNNKLKEKIIQSEYNATHDSLTEIYNRRMFEEIYELEINRLVRYNYPLSMVLLDIDNFKIFNDDYGHDIGDKVLIGLANLLRENIRSSDMVARWGGEEFVILFPNTKIEEANIKTESIRDKIENSFIYDNLKITCSFGVTSYMENDHKSSMFKRVDKALYEAKKSGRNQICIGNK